MRDTFRGNVPRQKSMRVVEIIGPAGAGKSTLCRLLNKAADRIQLQNFPDVRKVKDAHFFISNGLQLIPSLLRLYRPSSRHLTRREFAWLAILRGWSSLLDWKRSDDGKIIILDQGPVYLMAEMRLFGPEYLKHKDSERLWQDLYRRWRETLSMIISLDAADFILMNRIRNRQQELVVKNQPEAVVYEYLQKYRTEYEFLLSTFTSHNNGFKVFHYDTGTQQPDDLVKQLLQVISCGEQIT